jgi:hypothetical protein
MRSSFLGVVLMLTSVAPTAEAQVATPPAGAKCDAACLQAKVDRHLSVLMAEIGPREVAPEKREEAMQASLKDLAAAGPAGVRAAREAYDHWSREDAPEPTTGVRPGEMRWRAVHLLGSLGQREAIPTLHYIARTPLPEPLAVSEQRYADEYRIRLRAIAGLENLKAVDELKDVYEMGGVLRNPAAASLFELGVNLGRVRKVDAKTALEKDTADPKDYHPNKGRVPQAEKPGSPKADVKRRTDTPSVERRQ